MWLLHQSIETFISHKNFCLEQNLYNLLTLAVIMGNLGWH